jgi:hypothetical protein
MSCCGPATASENSSLRSTSPLLEGLHENIKLLVGNTRSSGMPALYAYSSCSASIKRRNGIATSHRELFHNRGGRLLLISNHLEPTPGSTISRLPFSLDSVIGPNRQLTRRAACRCFIHRAF